MVTLKALDRKDKREVFYVFPAQQKKSKSRLILTTPKSDCGTRTNTMSMQLGEELHQRQLKVAMDRVRHGKKYNDYDLVFCHTDGQPVDTKWLSRQFTKGSISLAHTGLTPCRIDASGNAPMPSNKLPMVGGAQNFLIILQPPPQRFW